MTKKKHIIFTIRYSLLMMDGKGKGGWKIGGESFDIYKKSLFDPKRLSIRQEMFKKITFSSLRKLEFLTPANISFVVHILTSEELPVENMLFLESLTKAYDFIEIKKKSVEEASLDSDFKDYLDNIVQDGEHYASVRLDDDDALSITWLKEIIYYISHKSYSNMVVSLSGGYALQLNNDIAFKKMANWKWRFASAGMAYIGIKKQNNLNIYSCGSHSATDNRFVTLLDSRGKYFVRVYNDFNDSGDKFPSTKENLLNDQDADEILLNSFGISLREDYNKVRIYDFHNFIMMYDINQGNIIKDKNIRNGLFEVSLREVFGRYYLYVKDHGYLNIDFDCRFYLVDSYELIDYEIRFISPVKFYIKNNDGGYLSSRMSNTEYRWQPDLNTWEHFYSHI